MEKDNVDRKKLIEDMETLKAKAMSDMEVEIRQTGRTEINSDELEKIVTVKYLGKIGISNEQGEIVEKDWYAVIKKQGNQFEIIYYTENQIELGRQFGMEGNIRSAWEIPTEMKKLKKEDIEKAKTLEELKEEQRQEVEEEKGEAGKLPGVDEEPQFSQSEVNKFKGPKVDLMQKAHGETIGQNIGLSGRYIQFVDADVLRGLIPDFEVASQSQKFVPIEIAPDGTANIIGEDVLSFSTIEGDNSTIEQTTVNTDGTRRKEQNIQTFNITNKGGMHTISIGFNEDVTSPHYEVEYGVRDKQQPSRISNTQLITVHEGGLKADKKQEESITDYDEGETVASKEPVSDDQARRFANAHGIFLPGTRIPNIDEARKQLEEKSVGGESVEDIIKGAEGEQMQLGPRNNQ